MSILVFIITAVLTALVGNQIKSLVELFLK